MKIVKIGGVFLLAAAAIFFGFHFFFGRGEASDVTGNGGNDENENLQELTYYRELSAQLETELSQLKQDQYTANKAYEERISELELLLKEQGAQEDKEPTPATTYTYIVEQNAVTITGYRGSDTKISIPAVIDGLEVAKIGREAFKDSSLVEVTLPNTVKKIDWFAFYGSSHLINVSIPSSVTKIEYGVFDGCEKLTVFCEKNSYADKYARSYGMRVTN